MSIADLAPGERAVITHVCASGAIRQRLLDMGLLPRTRVEVARTAPTGDPIWIKIGPSHLALRKREAHALRIASKEAP